MGADGYLVERGLIPMPASELKSVLNDAKNTKPVQL